MQYPQQAITAAAFLFEKSNGRELSQFEMEQINLHDLAEIDPEFVATKLKSLVAKNGDTDASYRQGIYWALGKKHDHSMISFFRERLREELRRDMEAVYQILIALDNLEESVFPANIDSFSSLNYEANRSYSETYLASI